MINRDNDMMNRDNNMINREIWYDMINCHDMINRHDRGCIVRGVEFMSKT